MASKKEHKRRQKAKARRQQDDEPQIFPGNELNSLNLLAQVSTSQSGTDGSADEAVANDAGEERENRAESGETSGELERLRYERNLHNAVAADAKERRDAAGSPAGGADADIDTAVNAVTPAGLEADRSLEEAQEAIQALRDAEAAERARIQSQRLQARPVSPAELDSEAAAAAGKEFQRAGEELTAACEAETEAADIERRRREADDEARAADESAEMERLRDELEAVNRAKLEEREVKERRRLFEEKEEQRAAAIGERVQRETDIARKELQKNTGTRVLAEQAKEDRLEAERRAMERREDAEQAVRDQEQLAAQQAEEAERRAKRMAEEADRARKMAVSVERARREAEAEETKLLQQQNADAESNQLKDQSQIEAEERARHMAEAAERIRIMAERVEKARRDAEEAERAYIAAEAAEKARREAEEEERASLAEAAERARMGVREAEQAWLDAEQADGNSDAPPVEPEVSPERRDEAAAAETGGGSAESVESESAPFAEPVSQPSAAPDQDRPAPLEVDNPYWEKPADVFSMMSGAFPGDAAETERGENEAELAGSLPVTCREENETCLQPEYDANQPEDEMDRRPKRAETQPVPEDKRMYIVMITPEVAPCAKVGGLGDVVLGLGRELMKRGHGVEVICPMYSSMRYDQIYDLHEEYTELWSPHYNEWRPEKVFQGKVEGGLQVNFITGGTYTERDSIYGYPDDLERFTYFSRQALEFMFKSNRRPDIIHCHDWPTGLVPAIYWDIYEKLGWDNSRFVYTIHNNECQGLCGFGAKLLGLVGLDIKNYHRPDRMQDDVHANCINMMKAGIVYSNFVTTVSPTFAGELKTAVGGRGLAPTIVKNSVKVGGVLNGLDYDSWNPETDQKLAARYTAGSDFYEKYRNKTALREWLGLNDAWKPIVSVVTRLTHQKGLDLIKHAIYSTLKMDGQFVLLGSAPDPKVNNDFLRIQHELRDNHDVNLYIGYHEDLSRMIYAGSDMFLVPSLYEPCGLTQMISLRYGTVPVVRETGGLVDTVFDLDNSGHGLNDANGFTFRDPTPVSLDYGLSRAIRLWYDNPEGFNKLARNGMHYDYSWRHPAEHYENIYNYIKV